jgi:hypothetical protein
MCYSERRVFASWRQEARLVCLFREVFANIHYSETSERQERGYSCVIYVLLGHCGLARPSAGGGAAESMTPKTPELTERRDDFTSRQQRHLS